jgi:hypothetical protein
MSCHGNDMCDLKLKFVSFDIEDVINHYGLLCMYMTRHFFPFAILDISKTPTLSVKNDYLPISYQNSMLALLVNSSYLS